MNLVNRQTYHAALKASWMVMQFVWTWLLSGCIIVQPHEAEQSVAVILIIEYLTCDPQHAMRYKLHGWVLCVCDLFCCPKKGSKYVTINQRNYCRQTLGSILQYLFPQYLQATVLRTSKYLRICLQFSFLEMASSVLIDVCFFWDQNTFLQSKKLIKHMF